MVQLFGLSGSLRRASLNSALLRAAVDLMPADATLRIGTIEGIPLYHGDLEAEQGLPEAVVALKEAIANADGLLLATPEYNNGIPGVFKNAIDWASRPASDIERVFGGRPAALMGASPGSFGTILSQNGWLPVLRTLGVDHWAGGRMLLPRAHAAFDEAGRLIDERARDRLARFLHAYVDHLKR